MKGVWKQKSKDKDKNPNDLEKRDFEGPTPTEWFREEEVAKG